METLSGIDQVPRFKFIVYPQNPLVLELEELLQTFLPYPSFTQSAYCLDNKRLGKQRVEARQILVALDSSYYSKAFPDRELPHKAWISSWAKHPAVKMWDGFEVALIRYGNAVIREWVRRGFKNKMPVIKTKKSEFVLPPWFGSQAFHNSHKSNLLRKDLGFYKQRHWDVPYNLPYVWPTK